MKTVGISWNNCQAKALSVYKKCVKSVLFWTLLFMILYLFLDFYNIPSFIGVRMKDINTDLLGITVGAITAFLVFFFTYRFVERWNVKRYNDQKRIALLILHNIYENCVREINTLDNVQLKKLAFSEYNSRVESCNIITGYAMTPFVNDEVIQKYIVDGAIPANIAIKYFEIKERYCSFVMLSALSYNEPQEIKFNKERMLKQIEEAFDGITQEDKKVTDYYAYNRKTI